MNKRSPVIFWLLLVATLAVDLIAWSSLDALGRARELEGIVFALVFGQLSVIGMWIVFTTPRGPRHLIVGAMAIVIAALALFSAEPDSAEPDLGVLGAAAFVATHLITLAMLLWVVRAAARRQRATAEAQFSVKNLLVLMTVVSVVAALLGGVTVVQQRWAWIFHFLGNNVAVAVASLLLWLRNWHWVWRLIAVLVVSALFGWCLTLSRPDLSPEAEWMSCLQAVVVFVWLEWGEIVPHPGYAFEAQKPPTIAEVDAVPPTG